MVHTSYLINIGAKEASTEKKIQFIKLMKIALVENYEERTKLIHKNNKRINEEEQQLSTNIRAVPNEDPESGEEWDYYYKGIKIHYGVQ